MAVVLRRVFGGSLQRMIVSKALLRCPSMDRSDRVGWFLRCIVRRLRVDD